MKSQKTATILKAKEIEGDSKIPTSSVANHDAGSKLRISEVESLKDAFSEEDTTELSLKHQSEKDKDPDALVPGSAEANEVRETCGNTKDEIRIKRNVANVKTEAHSQNDIDAFETEGEETNQVTIESYHDEEVGGKTVQSDLPQNISPSEMEPLQNEQREPRLQNEPREPLQNDKSSEVIGPVKEEPNIINRKGETQDGIVQSNSFTIHIDFKFSNFELIRFDPKCLLYQDKVLPQKVPLDIVETRQTDVSLQVGCVKDSQENPLFSFFHFSGDLGQGKAGGQLC